MWCPDGIVLGIVVVVAVVAAAAVAAVAASATAPAAAAATATTAATADTTAGTAAVATAVATAVAAHIVGGDCQRVFTCYLNRANWKKHKRREFYMLAKRGCKSAGAGSRARLSGAREVLGAVDGALWSKTAKNTDVRSHRSLVRMLRTARFARALRCAHSFARSLTSLTPSLVGK